MYEILRQREKKQCQEWMKNNIVVATWQGGGTPQAHTTK